MNELDKSIKEHVQHLTRPKAEQQKDNCLMNLKSTMQDKVNAKRRSNLDYWDRPQFDQELKQKE